MSRKVSIQPIPQPHPETEQQRPKLWMDTRVLKGQAQSKSVPDKDYCDICTSSSRICPHTWHKFTTHLDIVESKEEPEEHRECSWNIDIEDSGDYRAKAPYQGLGSSY